MKIALLGFDRQGRSAYEYWSSPDNEVTICDRKSNLDNPPPDAALKLGDNYLADLGQYDLLVRTPGLHPQTILDANPDASLLEDKITTVTNEFMRACPTKNIIGVTGTKGKGTTATLIAEMLHVAGKRVHLGGNIGIPPLDMLQGAGLLHKESGQSDSENKSIQQDDWVILELANYQLIDLQYSPHIAVCLMITPEHLDWHESLEEYLRAKQQIFTHQAEKDIAIYKAGDNRSMHLATTSLGSHIPYMEAPGAFVKDDAVWIDNEQLCHKKDVGLVGEHNLENVCAAATVVWQITPEAKAIREGIKNIKSLPHRLELIKEVNGVTFYNDSIGTTPETAIAALRAMTQPTIIILGGSDKGVGFDALAEEVANSDTVKHVVLIGKTGPVIEAALEKVSFSKLSYGGESMTEVVKTAYELAESGDAVLLSPACASFDMFVDYEDRGEQFSQAALALD